MLFQHTHSHTFIPPYPHLSYSCPLAASIKLVFAAWNPPISDIYLVCFSIIALISFDNSNIMMLNCVD